MKIVAISDTHNKLDEIEIPDGDVLVHAGDLTMGGSIEEFYKLNYDLGKIKHKFSHILLNAGNHDHLCESNPAFAKQLITNAKLLIEEEIIIDNIKFYFSPFSNWFYNWSFNFPETDLENGEIEATKRYAQIPDDVNVLITHGPPYNMLDKVNRISKKNRFRQHVGSTALAKRIDELKELKLYIGGHLHESAGMVKTPNVIFVNAAILDENYIIKNNPQIIEIN